MSIRTDKDQIDPQNSCTQFTILKPRVVKLTTRTEVDVRRTVPHKELRMIGAARELWNSHDQSIPDFTDEIKQRIPAPELPNLRLNPR